eukprot:717000-Rhodomonas_salina.1
MEKPKNLQKIYPELGIPKVTPGLNIEMHGRIMNSEELFPKTHLGVKNGGKFHGNTFTLS